MDDILGTSATNTSDLVLLAYVFLLLPGMIIGFFFARRKMFVPYHKFTMTGVTIVNWVLIAFVMLVTYSNYVAPYIPDNFSDIRAVVATIHLLSGALAQGLATYLVILMWTERTRFEGLLPTALRIRRIKTPMRLTLALWITTVVLGLGIYFTWYVGADEDPSALAAPGATEQAAPGSTEDAAPGSTEQAAPGSTEQAAPGSTEQAAPGSTEQAAPGSTEQAAPGSTEQAAPGSTEQAAPGSTEQAGPAVTEAASANLALTEDASNLALTEDFSANLALTEAVSPCPAVTEDAFETSIRPTPGPTDSAGCLPIEAVVPCPAMTEAVDEDDDDNRPVVTEAVTPPAMTEAVVPCPAVTEAADDNTRRPASTEAVDDDDDNGGSSNSGSGSGNSGSSNSGSGSNDDDD